MTGALLVIALLGTVIFILTLVGEALGAPDDVVALGGLMSISISLGLLLAVMVLELS